MSLEVCSTVPASPRCLIKQLLQEPINTSSLTHVEGILRFSVNSVAVAADIKRMLHQVFVSGG